jgi:acetyl esterase/lipase
MSSSSLNEPPESSGSQHDESSSGIVSKKQPKNSFMSFVSGLTTALTPAPILHLRPSWNTTFASAIQMLRCVAFAAPRDIRALRFLTDHSIPTWLPTIPAGVTVLKSKHPDPDGEWIYPSGLGRGFDSSTPPKYILYIHGGAFCCCNSGTHRGLLMRLVYRTQATLLSVNYRRPPEDPFPTPLDDCVAGYVHLLETLGPGAKNAHIIIAGDSAGGNLVVGTLLHLARMNIHKPAGGVLLSPWVDLTDLGVNPSWSSNSPIDYLPVDLARLFAECYIGSDTPPSKPPSYPTHSGSAGTAATITSVAAAVAVSSDQPLLNLEEKELPSASLPADTQAPTAPSPSDNTTSTLQETRRDFRTDGTTITGTHTRLEPEALSPLFYGRGVCCPSLSPLFMVNIVCFLR